jgi:2,3,4,5-tetrahydropyridine-2-carboxylate N-succinyltransferase
VIKAAELSGQSDLLFRQNSVTGAMEVLSQTVDWGSLNTALHQND